MAVARSSVSPDETPAGSDVLSFLAGRHVLLTGATGFVGKALLERLLRCCPHVASVQLLLRPKRGADAQQRLQQLLADAALDRVRAEQPAALAKVHALPGDVGEELLGLSDADRRRVCACVSVVFHSAATVRFNEPLREAVRTNVRGTQQMLQLCREMPQLKILVYVSTAFANSDKWDTAILEKVYPPPCDPYSLLNAYEMEDDVKLKTFEKQWSVRHQNTYTFSKVLAENLVADATDIPAAIVRPSVVYAALKEPFPGWLDSAAGLPGLMAGGIQGIFRGVVVDPSARADIVPIDYVVNVLLTAAWYAANHSSDNVLVFHCTSSHTNSVTWREFIEQMKKACYKTPTNYIVWYPNTTIHSNSTMNSIHFSLITKWIAKFGELMSGFQGQRIRLTKIAKLLHYQSDLYTYFLTKEWNFCNGNTSRILNSSGVDTTFKLDVSKMDWEKYIEQCVLGIRRHIFKEQADTVQVAKKKLNRFLWLCLAGKVLVLALLITFAKRIITRIVFKDIFIYGS